MADIDSLTRRLRASDPKDRLDAAEALCRLGEDASAAAVGLVAACGDSDDQVREWSVAALEGLGSPPATSVPALCGLARSENPLASYWAVTLLGRAGKDAQDAAGVLTACLESTDAAVRKRAAWALEKIGATAGGDR